MSEMLGQWFNGGALSAENWLPIMRDQSLDPRVGVEHGAAGADQREVVEPVMLCG